VAQLVGRLYGRPAAR